MRGLAILLLFASLASAQRARTDERFAQSGLEVGDPFPALTIHNGEGTAFDTASLKGFRTVVVSGCLT